jgi:hypothetical protein
VRARKEWGQVVVDPLEAKRWLLPRARRRKLPSSNLITLFCDYNPLLSRVKKRKGAALERRLPTRRLPKCYVR